MKDEREPSAGPDALGILDLARGVLADLDLDAVLERMVEAGRELTGARYAALGVLDRSGSELERFISVGIDEATRRRIGALPRGRGVLGELISDPQPLRVADVGSHPRSFGFPAVHPPMHTFLGVPILVAGKPFGNLYLTEKRGGEPFTEADEQALVRLAGLAGVAIDHAQRYRDVDRQRAELKRTVEALDATVQIAHAIGAETNLEVVLQLVAKRGRALVSARTLVIEHERDGELLVAAGAGELPPNLVGQSVDSQDSLAGAALRTARTLRLEDEPNRPRFERHGLGRLGFRARAGLVVPLIFRGQGYGALIALDRLSDGPAFTPDDQRLLEAFAASAATAVATAQSVEAERRRQRLAAAEQERAHWARELHDETLQNLAALRLGLASQLRSDNAGALVATMRESVELIDQEIASLRALISDLRPAALDDLGAEPAIEDLIERMRGRGLEIELSLSLAYERGDRTDRLTNELETAVYRLIQEALNNARRHGEASRAWVAVTETDAAISVTVRDDGRGFDPRAKTDGFGLRGMHERAELLDGTLEIQSASGKGTTVTVTFPTQRRGQARVA